MAKSRPPALLLLASLCAVPQPVRAGPRPPAPSPAVVRPGPPSLPIEPGHWLPLRVFPWQDDLKPTATSLLIDAQGYLWAGTPQGPIRYNGRTWRTFEIPHTGPPVAVWPIAAARDGGTWFGTEDRGVLLWKGGRWIHFGRDAGIMDDKVRVLVETADRGKSTIWAGTPLGLSRCTEAGCTPVKATRGLSFHAALPGRSEDGRPALWVGTDRGLLRLDDLAAPQPAFASLLFDHRNGLPADSVRSLAETVSHDGTRSLWVGTDHGLSRRRGDVWTRYDASSGFPDAGVTAMVASRSAQGEAVLWAGTFRAGLARFEDDGRWEIFDTSSGLPANYIFALLAVGDGKGEPTLWLSTAGGIARLDRERWRSITSRDGLPHDTVLGVGEATFPDGIRSYWAGTLGGMVRLGAHGWERFAPDPSLEPTAVRQVVSTKEDDGSLAFWMATVSGLRCFVRGRWTLLDSRSSPLPSDFVLRLLPVSWKGREALWVGTNGGLARIEGGRWTVFRRASGGLPGTEVPALLATPSLHGPPVVWAGTDKGLIRFADGLWTATSPPCQPHPTVTSLAWAGETGGVGGTGGTGWLWIGTRGGVARVRVAAGEIQAASCEALTDKTPLALGAPSISQIQIDDAGRIYLFIDIGVARLTLRPGNRLAAARFELFDQDDGLPGTFFGSASFKDHHGRLWAGSTGGVAIFEPSTDPQPGAPARQAPLYLEHVRVNDREHALPPGTVLRHDENSLELDFALLSFHREHVTRYRTQLAGLEREPTPWSREAREVYTRLPPGDYTFRVWGQDANGVISAPIERSFTIRRAPWLTTWAIALYALVLMGLGYGFNHLRLRSVARRAAALESLVSERTSELAEANRKLEQASLTDPLTGLSNRRFVALNIEPDLRLAERHSLDAGRQERNRDLLLYLLDIDRFKEFNDRAGHPAGDAVLIELARRLHDVARASDAVVRWGGEEFLLISRWTDRESGDVLAARILQSVGGTPFTYAPGSTATITCSVGWAPYPWRPETPDAVTFEQVLSLADRALYLAKWEGRDRAVGVRPGPDETSAIPGDGPLERLEGTSVELTRTPRGSREIPRSWVIM